MACVDQGGNFKQMSFDSQAASAIPKEQALCWKIYTCLELYELRYFAYTVIYASWA